MCNPITTDDPGKLLAKGVYEGFEWEVTSNGSGYRCGYVRVPAGHPWHGKDYYEIDVDVHGGLTFSEADEHCGKGGDDDAWWVGFDCAHPFDAPDPDLPGYNAHMAGMLAMDYGSIKSTVYVTEQCRALAAQAQAAAAL